VFNWQTAFLRTFHSHFEQPLDLEKWWTLQTVHFTGRTTDDTWSPAESWRKLDESLHASVEVRLEKNDLPGRAEVSLAAVIRQWDWERQSEVLRTKLRELELLRLRVSPDLAALVEDYRRVLAGYLDKRDNASHARPGDKTSARSVK